MGSLVRGRISVMRDIAEAASRDAENNPGLSEACTGWRSVGVTRSYEGNFVAARAALRRLARLRSATGSRPGVPLRPDIGVSATVANWPTTIVGSKGKSVGANDLAIGRASNMRRTGHVATMVYAHCTSRPCLKLVVRRDPVHAAIEVGAFAILARKTWDAGLDGLRGYSQVWGPWRRRPSRCRSWACAPGLHSSRAKIALYAPLLKGLWLALKRRPAKSTPRSASVDQALAETGQHTGDAGSKPSCTVSAARFCSSAIRRIWLPPRKPYSPPSPSRESRKRGASSCARRCRWRNFINRPVALPMPAQCSQPRSQVSRRRRNFRRLHKPNLCSRRLRPERMNSGSCHYYSSWPDLF